MAKRSVISGTVNGTPYRAHFQGNVTDEHRKFLEEIVAGVIENHGTENPTDG